MPAASAVTAVEPIEKQHFIYYCDHVKHVPLADSVLERTRLRLWKLVGDTLDLKAKVYITGDLGTFNSLALGRLPDWGAAVAYTPRYTIAIKDPGKFNIGKPLPMLLAHEYAHLVVAHKTAFAPVPRWFNEGLSMFVSTEWGWTDNLAMSKAAVLGDLLPLVEIEHLNRFSQSRAQVAYAQSYLAVKYLHESYGSQSLGRFLDAIAQGGSTDEALMAAAGATYKEFEKEFGEYIRERYNVATLFMDTIFLWIGLAVVVVVGAFLQYRKRRTYYKKWEREEKYQSTDFDYGDPGHPERTDDDDEPWRS